MCRRSRNAFSLVEVVLAVGVVAFAFVAIMGLIPAGMQQFRLAIDTSVGAQIAQRVIEEAEQTDFNTLIDYAHTQSFVYPNNTFLAPSYNPCTLAFSNTSPGACIRYFDESGNEIVPQAQQGNPPNLTGNPTAKELQNVVYDVITRIQVGTLLPQAGTSTTVTPNVATVTVQIAFNPGQVPLNISSQTNYLINTQTTPGVTLRTFSAQVGRNF